MFDIGLYGSGSYLIEFTVQAPILSEFTVQAPTVDDINPELHQNKKNILYNSHLRSLRSCSIHIINSIFGLFVLQPENPARPRHLVTDATSSDVQIRASQDHWGDGL